MPQNKKQHFVPKFYLRNFSADRKTIGIFHIASRRVITGASISDQCCRDYFYGKDLRFEHAFGKLEGSASHVIRDILMDGGCVPKPLSPEHIVLSHFIVFQASRTAYEAEAQAEGIDKFFKAAYRDEVGNLDGYEIGFDDPVLMSLRAAARVVPAVYDLKVKLLHNRTNFGFITSDNPVVRHNQLFEGNDHAGQTGWAQAGLQVFVPLSRSVVCCFYDGGTYKVGGRNERIVEVSTREEVDRINALQWLNAHKNIYFFDGDQQAIRQRASTPIARRRSEKTSVLEHELHVPKMHRNPDEQYSLLHEYRPGLNLRLKLDCMKLRRHPRHPRHDYRPAPVRDEEYVRIVERFGQLLAVERAKPEDFFRFAASAQRREERQGAR